MTRSVYLISRLRLSGSHARVLAQRWTPCALLTCVLLGACMAETDGAADSAPTTQALLGQDQDAGATTEGKRPTEAAAVGVEEARADSDGRVSGPISGGQAEDPYACIASEAERDAKCGYEWLRDATLCGVEVVQDAALCGAEVVTSAALCGASYVEDGAFCGYSYVKDGAKCGSETVTDAAICGYTTVTSATQCGWNFLKGLFGGKKPKRCKVAGTCRAPKRCRIANKCEKPRTCPVAKRCRQDRECQVPKRCKIEVCTQSTPGGQCVPGLAECSIEGFACQPSFDSGVFRCLPAYDFDPADHAACEAMYDPNLAALARAGGLPQAYSAGGGAAAVLSRSLEIGTAYGAAGEYGCFSTRCEGEQTDVNIAAFANLTTYVAWDKLSGGSRAFSLGVSTPVAEFGVTTAPVLSSDYAEYYGQADMVSYGVGVLPVQLGHAACTTTLYQTR